MANREPELGDVYIDDDGAVWTVGHLSSNTLVIWLTEKGCERSEHYTFKKLIGTSKYMGNMSEPMSKLVNALREIQYKENN